MGSFRFGCNGQTLLEVIKKCNVEPILLVVEWFKLICDQGGGCPGKGPVKYDIVHTHDQGFSKQPLNEFGSLPKNDP